jgi:superfamily II DNA or RNA helicase
LTYSYDIHESINLHVRGRISEVDARRQKATARVILHRLEVSPGIILADEVGMGKTFVALAVAASVAIRDSSRRPVVVMVPPSLKEKWPKDFRVFKERCIVSEGLKKHLTAKSAENAVQFLKLLDDAPYNRVSIIFLTHGAMSPYRKLQDGWVKLAIIQKALFKRQHVKKIRRAMCRYMGELLRMKYVSNHSNSVWEELLTTSPNAWLDVLIKHNLTPVDRDDPVPEAVLDAIEQMDLYELYATLRDYIPYRKSDYIENRLKYAREAINDKIVELWDHCIRSLKIKLPLLILDEAHHLKNPHTQLASLFHSKEAEGDAAELSRGPLAEVFERMLFLTATPFQLGHYELCSVLERFTGISWKGPRSPSIGKDAFQSDLKNIRSKLDTAQEAAVRLDHLWGRLRSEDLTINGQPITSIDEWWEMAQNRIGLTPAGEQILERYKMAKLWMREAEESLKHYVIRHSRPKTFHVDQKEIPRRKRYAGRAISDNHSMDSVVGLSVQGETLLPFLLAARVTALKPDTRPVFAEGLASSYEAFLHTRSQRMEQSKKRSKLSATDWDDEKTEIPESDNLASWYLDKLQSSIFGRRKQREAHPKVTATVQKALHLWQTGEKVLIFCHYLATGEILQKRLDKALDREIYKISGRKLKCATGAAAVELEKISNRFFAPDSPIRRGTNRAVKDILKDYSPLKSYTERILRITRRYSRTPSFLARYFPLDQERLSEETIYQALGKKDASGMSFDQLLRDFFSFLVDHCGEDERDRYLGALESVQPGSKVRLANGLTKQEMRQRLMLTFNTPFYPEILVASMIMAEGVDLHLNCRHVIHHDLCWNPSTLEQRTGRIDRIGAKVERCCQPIEVYMPYISETQDEKMYRVVMDRERWFKVVMGESYKVDARTTEKLASRIPFPESAANELTFDLRVF